MFYLTMNSTHSHHERTLLPQSYISLPDLLNNNILGDVILIFLNSLISESCHHVILAWLEFQKANTHN